MKRYLTGVMPGGSIGFCLEGPEDELFSRIWRLVKTSQRSDVVWEVAVDDPFDHGQKR